MSSKRGHQVQEAVYKHNRLIGNVFCARGQLSIIQQGDTVSQKAQELLVKLQHGLDMLELELRTHRKEPPHGPVLIVEPTTPESQTNLLRLKERLAFYRKEHPPHG